MMTLLQMKEGMADKVTQMVVDLFIRKSEILELLPFDNCISPSGGSTLTYGYMQTAASPDRVPAVQRGVLPRPRASWKSRPWT
jgi:hypothetical protein